MARLREEQPAWGPKSAMRLVNHDLPRVDGPDKVSGRAVYTHDVRLPEMVYARVLTCPRPSAKVTVDVEPAMAVAGVVDAYVPEGIRQGNTTRFLGEPIAVVTALTPEQAEDGLRALGVRYEEEGWVLTYDQAVAPDAPVVGRNGNVTNERENGDEDATGMAFDSCDAVVEAEYSLPVQHHACLETHGHVVDYRGGDEATIYASTQGTSTIAGECADALELPVNKVRVLVPHMGGGFGGKFGPGAEGLLACRVAKRLNRPVHLMLKRPDEFLMAGNRSGSRQRLKGGATADGKLRALSADITRLGGLGRGSHPGMPYIYEVEASHSVSRSVHTNTDANRAMRAPGHPQASFAIESMVDELAYELGMDPLEFRLRNLAHENYARHLERVADEIGWTAHPHRTRPGGPRDWTPDGIATGIGFGVSTWRGSGGDADLVTVIVARDGSVTVTSGAQDIGVGVRTYLQSIVAEELKLPAAAVTQRVGDSNFGPGTPSGGSTTSPSLAPAVKVAAHAARLALFAKLAPQLESQPDQLEMLDGGTVAVKGDNTKRLTRRFTWREACAALGADGITVTGKRQAHLSSSNIQGAQAAKVEVDTLTGAVRVVKMVCMQNMGLCLNPLTARSQINGGMIQALSYGLFEEQVFDADLGVALNANFEDYKLAGCQEMPELVALIDDEDDRGVIGMAEAPIIPGHGAIANAVFNACGVRMRHLPMTPDKVLMALVARRERGGKR